MTVNLNEFRWLNESELKIENGKIYMTSASHSDIICNPLDGSALSTAPFFYQEIEGDFLISACVKPTFVSTYDACALVVYADERHWLKTCFEYTDFETNSIVTVATDTTSDESIGADIEADSVYLQIMRKGNVFACHYSVDGKTYQLSRKLRLNVPNKVKIGISVQSPTGAGQVMEFSDLHISQTLPEDMRKSK